MSLAPLWSKSHSQLNAEYTQRSLSGACTRDASSFAPRPMRLAHSSRLPQPSDQRQKSADVTGC